MQNVLKKLAQDVHGFRIAVIGDAMLDENIEGPVLRISPEAPVVLLSKALRRALPGGAANVVACIASLGAHCAMIGLVGNDAAAQELRSTMRDLYPTFKDCLVSDASRHTTVKTRFWGTGYGAKHLLLRVDAESPAILGKEKEEILSLIRELKPRNNSEGYDFIAISDYAKGVIDADVLNAVIETKIPVIVAPKPVNNSYMHLQGKIRGLHTLLPNFSEAKAMAKMYGCVSDDVAEIAKALQREFDARIVITRGKDGIYALDKDGSVHQDSAKAHEVFDVTGAGDVVLAAYAVASCANVSLQDAIHVANLAGGIKVGKIGVATVSLSELTQAAEKLV